jgi:ABC-type transport system substrate-binding protein
VATRDLGAEVEVELPSGDDPLFYYTASDQRLSELGAIAALPPARTWLGLDQLPPLNRMLRATDPDWAGWLGQIAGRATQDGISLGPALPTLVTIVDGEPQPNLALSWEANEDGTNWVFDLDPDRERADGTPYTAGFVAEVLGLPENGPQLVAGFAGVEVIDDFTILVFLEAPNPEFLVQIAGIVFP